MTHLDGNVLAGELADLVGHDLTASEGQCAGCGQVSAIAETDVYLSAMGAVLRCRGCTSVLAVVVLVAGHRRVSLSGIASPGLREPR